jgi:dinuclear metal center YbgI/SA1388 family protein
MTVPSSGNPGMPATVTQFLQLLDHIAPPRLAEAWDNVGLQIGSLKWPVEKVWTALDPLPEVVERACENGVDLLVTHHPLIFKPVKRIEADSSFGRIARVALSQQLSIVAAHTNLDSVPGGVNDALADRMGLVNVRALAGQVDPDLLKVVVFVPSPHVQAVLAAMFATDAGHIGDYTCCSFRCEGVGTFQPGQTARPAVGETGRRNDVQESRIEIAVRSDRLDALLEAIRRVHPYETTACDIYPLKENSSGAAGLGRLGELTAPVALETLCGRLKSALNLSTVKLVGQPHTQVNRVALCSGSGASLAGAAIASGAQVYISGDLGYHTAREAQQADMALIDIGHFGSEHLIVDALAAALRQAIETADISATVEACGMETDPFHYR